LKRRKGRMDGRMSGTIEERWQAGRKGGEIGRRQERSYTPVLHPVGGSVGVAKRKYTCFGGRGGEEVGSSIKGGKEKWNEMKEAKERMTKERMEEKRKRGNE
jgi:hypothetical protein